MRAMRSTASLAPAISTGFQGSVSRSAMASRLTLLRGRRSSAVRAVGGQVEVGAKAVQAALAPIAGLLVAAEGEVGSKRLKVLAHTTPARMALTILKMRLPFSVQTPADRP